jgi:NADPH:quinone reductase-like Zn-dependent oxidoreductase
MFYLQIFINSNTVIQFARIAGFSPIVTTASSQHANFLKSLGATHVFDRDADVQTIQSAFPVPVALAYDAISADSTQLLAFDVLTTPAPKSDARIILVNPPTDSLGEKNKGDKIIVDNVRVFGLSDTFSTPFWQKIGQWVEGGEIVPNRVQLVGGGLAGVPEALDLSRKGVSGVKLVVRPQE